MSPRAPAPVLVQDRFALSGIELGEQIVGHGGSMGGVERKKGAREEGRTSAVRLVARFLLTAAPFRPRGSAMARSISAEMSSSVSGCSVRRSERDSSGEITEKEGFSVVAPIKVNKPDST